MKGKLKNKLMNNLMIKILSIIVAFLFWLAIINITDPTTTRKFTNIPVKVLNENVITSANQVYEIEEGDTVGVTVKGKRSVIESLNRSDFQATADMSDLSAVNAVNIKVEVRSGVSSSDDIEVDWGNAMMKVKLEDRETQKFQVKVEYQGDVANNYVLGEIIAKPNIIEVSCGASKFKKIDHVGVLVTLNKEKKNFVKEYKPVLYDADGDIIDSSNVTFGSDTINVSIEVLPKKEISLDVKAKGKPAEGYRLAQTVFQPETIWVSGKASALKQEESITIPIDITGAKKDVEREIDLTEYLSDGVSIVGDTTTVSVRCEIEESGSRSFTLTSSDIAIKNLPANSTVAYEDESLKYSITLTGKDSVLEGLSLGSMGAYVDLAGCGIGEHTLEVKFNLPSGVKLKKKIKVVVILRSQNGESITPTTETATPDHTASPTPEPEAEEKTEEPLETATATESGEEN